MYKLSSTYTVFIHLRFCKATNCGANMKGKKAGKVTGFICRRYNIMHTSQSSIK